MSTERIISEEGETNPELEAPQENNVEPELQPQNIIDYQNVHDINQPSNSNKIHCCTCCHSFLAILIMSSIIIVTILELKARYRCDGLYSLVDIFVGFSILILIVLLIIYIKLKKEKFLNAFTFYHLFTLFWSVPSLLSAFFYSNERSKYERSYKLLKGGKLLLILISFIINFAFFKCKKSKQE